MLFFTQVTCKKSKKIFCQKHLPGENIFIMLLKLFLNITLFWQNETTVHVTDVHDITLLQ